MVRARRWIFLSLSAAAACFLPIDLSWLAEAMIGAWLLWLWTRPSWREIVVMMVLAAVLFGVRSVLDPTTPEVAFELKRRLGYFPGWAAIFLLAYRGPSPSLTGALAFPLFILVRYQGLVSFALYDGPTADGQMFILDHALGDPAYRMGWMLYSTPTSISALWVLYRSFIWTLPIAVGATLRQPSARSRILVSWIVAGVFSLPFYLLCPVAGPAYAFPPWPRMPDPATVTWAPLAAPDGWLRTGMPSLHFTWALLTWILAPAEPRWLRPVMLTWVGITFVTTLALGQHWIVDLIGALPFTGMVLWVTTRLVPGTVRPRLPARQSWPYGSAAIMGGIGLCLMLAAALVGGLAGFGLAVFAAWCLYVAVVDVRRVRAGRGPLP